MSYEAIEYDVEEEELRATIRFNRPDKLNALSPQLLSELNEALIDAEANENVRAIVITGNGRAFSAGYDLEGDEEAASGGDAENPIPSTDDLIESMERSTEHLYTIWELNKPVIAAVNGYCLAGGSDLAMLCDILIASENASFGYPGQRIAGHPPALTYPFFIGLHQAKELLYTGKIVDADRALQMGVFNRVVPHEELLDEAYAEVDDIKKVPGTGVRIQKHSLNSVVEQQGFHGTLKNSEFLDSLAHLTDLGKEYLRIANSNEGLDEPLKWMNEKDKRMRDLKEDAQD